MSGSASLLITPILPGGAGYGLRMRAGLLLSGLRRLGPVHVVVVPVHGPEPIPFSHPEVSGVRVTALDIDRSADARADFVARLADPSLRDRAAALHPRPALCHGATVAAARRVADLAAGARRIVVMRLYLAPFLDLVLEEDHRPACVIDVDDVESSTRRHLGELDEAASYERLEHHYLPRFDRVLTCSEEDAQDLATRYGVDADVVPNAVTLPDAPPPTTARQDLLFVGNLSYAPNVEGAQWLCREVLPLLPSATVALAGRDPAPDVTALARQGQVSVTGTVPNVTPLYAVSRVAVVPLWAGGGTSIKLLEAFAHRRPVVSTTVGARGLPVRDGEHLLLADEPDAFAVACRRLLTDTTLAAGVAAAGHDLVRHRFTTEQVSARLAELLRGATVRAGDPT